MGNALAMQPSQIIIQEDDPLLRDYKKASVNDYYAAKDKFDTLQATVGDKMTVASDEFDEIFSLICQDPSEHFELFDCWEIGKVDVMEVFAVVIVYCKAPIETKIPLLFDLFDFDHSHEISQYELVLLMLCTTRGLCKAVGLDRPGTDELEELANLAFGSIDRDRSGAISLHEFSDWALHEPNLLLYLKRFASTRLIYENQLQHDTLLKQLCDSFVQFAIQVEHLTLEGSETSSPPQLSFLASSSQKQQQQLACSTGTCKEVIRRHCPHTEEREAEYLVHAMQTTMAQRSGAVPDALMLPQMVTMDVFCLIAASYVAFIVADEDKEHMLNLDELKILLWLIRGKEPLPSIVDSYMKSLDWDHNGMLSALEWVTFAIENDSRTGTLSFPTQVQLLFTNADRNGDAMLTLQELCNGLKPMVLQSMLTEAQQRQHQTQQKDEVREAANAKVASLALEKQLQTHGDTIHGLITGLANELMLALDKNQSHRIEWYEFRQQLDYLEIRVSQMKRYIQDFVLL
uniref:EF-hand domain-containing protein n=1 Tax=Globisporangium ultimum (strain ATCC 200006 / CBS 805.95 / DAOM BR144) TaxID=431595 RepID=K3W6A4_GLOUD